MVTQNQHVYFQIAEKPWEMPKHKRTADERLLTEADWKKRHASCTNERDHVGIFRAHTHTYIHIY